MADTPDDDLNLPDPLADDDEDGELHKLIRQQIAAAGKDTDDGDDIGDMPDAEPEDRIAAADGIRMIEKAAVEKPKPDTKPESEGDDDDAKADDSKPADLTALERDALLEGLADDRRQEVARRLTEAEAITGLFKGQEAELQRHGVTPKDAVARFLHLNTFAQQKPDEYVAWVVKETGGDKAAEVLGKAAALLGLRVVPEEEDPFEDESVKALREENRRLKQQAFGPDAALPTQPQPAAAQVPDDLNAFITAAGPDGAPLRPHFDLVGPQIARRAQEHVQRTGKPVQVTDLATFYDEEVRAMQARLGVKPAAQGDNDVASLQRKAASAAKAKEASKSVGGAGQGASRDSGLSEDVPIGEVIKHFAGLKQR